MNFNAALRIVYPLRDPVVSDTALHLAALEVSDSYAARVKEIVDYLKNGPNEQADVLTDDRMLDSVGVFIDLMLKARLDSSLTLAIDEFRKKFHQVASLIAQERIKKEDDSRAEDYAVERMIQREYERCQP